MADSDYTARKIVTDGMEVLRFRCEERDWQRQLARAKARAVHRRKRHRWIQAGLMFAALTGAGFGLAIDATFAYLGAAAVGLPATAIALMGKRRFWFPDGDSDSTPPEVVFTSTGLLVDERFSRPWRGAGYRLIDAHVSDDVSPWIELSFRKRLWVEVFELPVPDGLLKSAMEITEMLRAKGRPVVESELGR